MEKRSGHLRTLAELIAAVGVVTSLLFVGLELRQNTVAVRGATFQALSDASADDLSAVAHDPELAWLLEAVYWTDAGLADFEPAEDTRLFFYSMGFVRRLENSYLQQAAGVVGDRVFESYGWNDALLQGPHFVAFWSDLGGAYGVSRDFAEFMEARLGVA